MMSGGIDTGGEGEGHKSMGIVSRGDGGEKERQNSVKSSTLSHRQHHAHRPEARAPATTHGDGDVRAPQTADHAYAGRVLGPLLLIDARAAAIAGVAGCRGEARAKVEVR